MWEQLFFNSVFFNLHKNKNFYGHYGKFKKFSFNANKNKNKKKLVRLDEALANINISTRASNVMGIFIETLEVYVLKHRTFF